MGTTGFERVARARVARYRRESDPSATAILSTFFGEIVEPRDVLVPVSSVAAVVADLGISERLVRTSLSRLVADGLLEGRRVGRRSAYGVAPDARQMFGTVRARIFGAPTSTWGGWWTLVIVDPTGGDGDRRARLRAELRWQGLTTLSPNVLASPVVDPPAVLSTVERHGDLGVIVMRSQLVEGGPVSGPVLAARALPLDDLAAQHQRCIEHLAPLERAVGDPSPATALALRLLLISEYRRLVLADPGLPAELLPDSWRAARTREIVASVFHRVLEPSERRLAEVCPTLDGLLPSAPCSSIGRFAPAHET